MEYSKTKVVGSALYFELERKSVSSYGQDEPYERTEVKQVVLLPYFTLGDSRVRVRTLKRVVDVQRPRSRWESYSTHAFAYAQGREEFDKAYEDITNDITTGAPPYNKVSNEDAEKFAMVALDGFVHRDLLNHFKIGWTLVGKPFAVEISEEDAYHIKRVATPTGLVKRIERVKKALGYPDISRAREKRPVPVVTTEEAV